MVEIALKGKPIRTNGQLPKKGTKAPNFVLVGQELDNFTLENFQGKRKLLSIVPSLDTGVCSAMTKKFNESVKNHPEVAVLVISADLPFAQKRFCNQEKTHNVTTLSMMRSKDFARDYGVLIENGPLAGICARAVVILDKNNQVVYTQLVPEVTNEPNYEEALSHLFT